MRQSRQEPGSLDLSFTPQNNQHLNLGFHVGLILFLAIVLSEHFREGKTIVSAWLAEASVVWIHALERPNMPQLNAAQSRTNSTGLSHQKRVCENCQVAFFLLNQIHCDSRWEEFQPLLLLAETWCSQWLHFPDSVSLGHVTRSDQWTAVKWHAPFMSWSSRKFQLHLPALPSLLSKLQNQVFQMLSFHIEALRQVHIQFCVRKGKSSGAFRN